jgi:hypothetical protein
VKCERQLANNGREYVVKEGKTKYYVQLTSKTKMEESKIRNIVYNTQTKSVIEVNSYVQEKTRDSVSKKKITSKGRKMRFLLLQLL